MEDLIQAATLAYWKHQREGRPVPFCFVCARQAAEKHFYRQIMGRNPRNPFSLDARCTMAATCPTNGCVSPSL